jgi:CMP/dCMP kinase
MIVAIDGPAGSGKSTTARAVARRLGFRHLDSGAFYRALTHAALAAGIPAQHWDALDEPALAALGVRAEPGEEGYHFFAGDEAIDAALRSADVNAHVSLMARVPGVRAWLLGRLRAAAENGDLVADGRDIGTVVFPDAELKIFLVADPAERARRRLREQGVATPTPRELDAEIERLRGRDRIDSERAIAPLRKADDAIEIDTSRLSFEEQVERVAGLARARMDGEGGNGNGG